MKYSKLFCILIVFTFVACKQEMSFDVSLLNTEITSGNSWVINDASKSSEVITKEGITNWQDANDTIRAYFYTEKEASIPFGIIAKGTSEFKISYNNKTESIKLENSEFDTIYIDNYNSEGKGYNHIDFHDITNNNIEIKSILIKQPDDNTLVKYIKDDFYFGRRGPSTHLVYETPTDDIEWMYNEIEIDKDQDVIGSYFMANGFGEGYFGIQVNSENERRILFSIWSPFKTDDPNSIPDDQKIKLLKKGEGVTTGEFGNEGSGGQSYKVFNWKAETRYGFLTRVKPNGKNATDYTSYFFDPDTNQWHLIASFRRPITNTYVTRPYSFLENFIPNTGALARQGGFYNQWMRDSKGVWYEITEAKFSADATARKDARLDYSGGIINDGFYLMNCGFTNDHTTIGTMFTRATLSVSPIINFNNLE
ncbi:DUF3472 domain-containing protein [Flavobacteriaceae bacterium S0825]|uniref:DUF3472 domain-containing protein n=1 Tax=Gaetbulibacter sp. S0825 TaxID=2720084 RepID=UPI001430CA8E|nr:DUF3472 domain-containing protein [Gaetbulibacter sp. S0825]MCK0110251.1 DUF3472 domain-containing protein [Flavobacteriaceae bacterium S0825]NIX65879.1 DUF3472 domain-containing protein [Gaetbulibacter sp. S0825]